MYKIKSITKDWNPEITKLVFKLPVDKSKKD